MHGNKHSKFMIWINIITDCYQITSQPLIKGTSADGTRWCYRGGAPGPEAKQLERRVQQRPSPWRVDLGWIQLTGGSWVDESPWVDGWWLLVDNSSQKSGETPWMGYELIRTVWMWTLINHLSSHAMVSPSTVSVSVSGYAFLTILIYIIYHVQISWMAHSFLSTTETFRKTWPNTWNPMARSQRFHLESPASNSFRLMYHILYMFISLILVK